MESTTASPSSDTERLRSAAITGSCAIHGGCGGIKVIIVVAEPLMNNESVNNEMIFFKIKATY